MKRGTDYPPTKRFAVNAWTTKGERDGDETTHDVFNEARDEARRRWSLHKGTHRVTIWDDYIGVVLSRLDPGPIELRDIPCHNPEHDVPPESKERRKTKRNGGK